jgi:hypothetical protein
MAKLEMDTHASAKNDFNMALIQKLSAMRDESVARAHSYGRSIDRDGGT